MKSLRNICCMIISIIIFVCSVCGCGKDNNNVLDNSSVVQELPENDVLSRWYDEYQNTLTPSAEYGDLIPFVGGYKNVTDENGSRMIKIYGLCTTDGKIVVDAVYTSAKQYMLDANSYVYLATTDENSGSEVSVKTFLISGTGEWIMEVPKNTVVTENIGGGMIMCERTVTANDKTIVYHDFYNNMGKKAFTFDKTISEDANIEYKIGKFADGFAPVNAVVTVQSSEDELAELENSEPIKTNIAFYIDVKGKKTYEGFTKCEEFVDGLAVVADQNGALGIINNKGEYFVNPIYRVISHNKNKGIYCCGTNSYFDIIDKSGTQIKRVLSDKGKVEVLGHNRLIYKKTNAHTGRSEYFYADNNVPFTYSATGQFPDEKGSIGGYYVCSYGGNSSIFNESGETVVSLNDFGRFAIVCGENLVVTNQDNTKIAIIVPGKTKKVEWLDMSYTNQPAISNRYIVLKRTAEGKIVTLLYDLQTGEILFDNSESITVINSSNAQYLSVVNNGKTRICDTNLNNILLFSLKA